MAKKIEAMEPIVKTVDVALAVEDAFTLFTDGMGEWWPGHTHSIAADTFENRVTVESLVFECFEGGRIYEVMSDGREGDWGVVLAWEPPTRVIFSWNPSLEERPSTEVEVRFTDGESGTRVVLEHRGWERLGAVGPEMRNAYQPGWDPVLAQFSSAAEARSS